MSIFFNPAAGLTANRIPYALGGGRLGDAAAMAYDPAGLSVGLGNRFTEIRLPGYGPASAESAHRISASRTFNYGDLLLAKNIRSDKTGATDGYFSVVTFAGGYSGIEQRYGGDILFYGDSGATTADASITPKLNARIAAAAGNLILSNGADIGNGRVQLPTHSTSGGGYGFFDFSLYRDGAASARMNAALRAVSLATDAGGDINTGGDIRLGTNSGGIDRWIYDRTGNVILKNRSAVNPVTLADVITILKYHGLCA